MLISRRLIRLRFRIHSGFINATRNSLRPVFLVLIETSAAKGRYELVEPDRECPKKWDTLWDTPYLE